VQDQGGRVGGENDAYIGRHTGYWARSARRASRVGGGINADASDDTDTEKARADPVSDIEAIKAEAAARESDQAVAEAMPAGVVVPVVDPVVLLSDEVAGLIGAVVAALSPALPSLSGIYTASATKAAASAIAAVCVKRGWLSGGLFGEYKEEISAAVILIPIGMATYQGVMADLAMAKRVEKEIVNVDAEASED
jgi:hypothetical protein